MADDIERARGVYPDAPVIAVNGAARLIPANFLVSMHPVRFTGRGFRWIARQQKFGTDFTVHAPLYEPDMPWVDYWWPDARGGGGSAWAARKVAWLMGFDPVVLCGCPLIAGPYIDHRLYGMMTRENVVDDLCNGILAEPEWHEGVTSMSGWTRELFGEPC